MKRKLDLDLYGAVALAVMVVSFVALKLFGF